MNKILKINDDRYFSAKGISNSFLLAFDRNPRWAHSKKKTGNALSVGLRLHKFLLEPIIFEEEYVMAPPECDDRIRKPYPEFKKTTDKEIILYKEYKRLESIRDEVMNYEIKEGRILGDIIRNSQKEMALFWDQYDIQRKAKIDLLCELPSSVIVCDLKKTQNCLEFPKSASKYKYHRQAATYSDGAEILLGKKPIFYFITIETEFPYGVKVHRLSDGIIELGRQQNLASIEKYKAWDGKITGYEQGVNVIDDERFFIGG